MLTEYKNLYKENARRYPGWNTATRSELCYDYVKLVKEGKDGQAQDCLSAILYRFWNLASHAYYAQEKVIATENDCYNWLVESVMFCLKSKSWEDPDSTIYKDPNGPEKAINVCFTNEKINFFVGAKRQKRVANYDSFSLEALQEDASDSYYMPVYDEDVVSSSFFYKMIKDYYNKKDYLPAFILDSVLELDFFDRSVENNMPCYQFSRRKLKHHLREMDETYCKYFAQRYNLNSDDVLKASKYVTNLSYDRMTRGVNNFFKSLERNKTFMEEVKC